MLGQSAARVTHEMGNQFGILPLIEIIEDEYQHDHQLLELDDIARVTYSRLQQLVNEIQSFVRIDNTDGRPIPFSLTTCINVLISHLRFNHSLDISRLKTALEEDSTIIGSPFKMQQVLINLIRNAMDAISKDSTGHVELRLERSNHQAHITVRDNGQGIPPNLLDMIWTPFFTTKGKSGTGLGLDVVQSIIKNHAGTTSCESVVGQRTKFEISLPVSLQASFEVVNKRMLHDVAQPISQNAATR